MFSWRIRTARGSPACEHRPRHACNVYRLQTLNHAQRAPNHSEKTIRNVILIVVHYALWPLKDVRAIYGELIVLKSCAAPLIRLQKTRR